jgi:rubrerythrin
MKTATTQTQTQTLRNLEAAFAGESMAYQKYLYFAKLARDKGDEEAARLFEETAKQETGHAYAHLSLMYPPDKLSVEQVLRLAIEGERYEHTVMYPGYEEQARKDRDSSAEREFREQAGESKGHEKEFAAMLEKARRRFGALTKVEKRHADRYQKALNERSSRGKTTRPSRP